MTPLKRTDLLTAADLIWRHRADDAKFADLEPIIGVLGLLGYTTAAARDIVSWADSAETITVTEAVHAWDNRVR
jgi:hypothetical protein